VTGALEDTPRLNGARGSATVPSMPAPLAYGRELHRHRQRQFARRRRVALAVALATVTVGTLLVTAFGGSGRPSTALTPQESISRLLPAGSPAEAAIAHLGSLAIEYPVNQTRVTAIGYYGSSDGALTLQPIGAQANQGLLRRLWNAIAGGGQAAPRWYLLPGGQSQSTSALEVGAPAGTYVYAPVSGTIVGIDKVILDGEPHGDEIDIQPTLAPSLVVSVSAIAPDPSLVVGGTVTEDATKLGEVLDLAVLETQAIARYTNDAGNHVLIEVHPAATLDVR
jgi:hypothetical protein